MTTPASDASTAAHHGAAQLKLGSYFNPGVYASDALSYDDKAIASISFDGKVDTITHLPGDQFFYGALRVVWRHHMLQHQRSWLLRLLA